MRVDYKLQNFPVAMLPNSYLQYKTNHTCQPRPHFAWILFNIYYYFPNHWSMQDVFYLFDKALILKLSLTLSKTNSYIWSRKRVWLLIFLKYESKIFLVLLLKCIFSNPGRWRFLAILVSDTKMSKLIFCFSMLLLQVSCSELRNI